MPAKAKARSKSGKEMVTESTKPPANLGEPMKKAPKKKVVNKIR
ncbi:MAG: hypothetical protein ABSE82_16090 [Nitrososphaerales archaeon]